MWMWKYRKNPTELQNINRWHRGGDTSPGWLLGLQSEMFEQLSHNCASLNNGQKYPNNCKNFSVG